MTTRHTPSNSARYTDEDLTNLIAGSSHLPEAELRFALDYMQYYTSSHTKVIPTQLYRSTKYALTIAHVAVALKAGQRMKVKEVGDLVEYSYASVWEGGKPDPADYDINLLRGAFILRCLPFKNRDLDPRSTETVELGAGWETVCVHWDHLSQQPASHIAPFVNNLKDGGAISLSDGLL